MRIKTFSCKSFLLFAAVALAGCEDNFSGTASDSRIAFRVSEYDCQPLVGASSSYKRAASDMRNVDVAAYGVMDYASGEGAKSRLQVREFDGGVSGNALYLHTSVEDGIRVGGTGEAGAGSTRVTPVTQNNFQSLYGGFQMHAYKHNGGWANHTSAEEYMDETIATTSGLTGVSTKEWPCSGDNMTFFAYAPAAVRHNGADCLTVLSSANEGVTVRYEVPNDVAAQKDLLAAVAPDLPDNSRTAVGLTFYHALTAVRFVVDEGIKVGTITRISLKNVYGKASHQIGSDVWTDYDGMTDYSILESISVPDGGGATQNAVTTEEQTFMMIPQAFSGEAASSVEVVYSDGSSTRTLTASLTGSSWRMGKTVTYKVSPSGIAVEPTLTVVPSPSNPGSLSHTGGDMKYTVTSYATIAKEDGTLASYPVDWTAQYSDDGATWSDTLPLVSSTRVNTANDARNISSLTVSLATAAQDITSTGTRSYDLWSAAAKGSSAAPYNLSNASGSVAAVENTANCYVVDAPGTYCIPLVYGNAIKDGADNTGAYNPNVSGGNVLAGFVDYRGNNIVSPWIEGYGDATVVWNDTGFRHFVRVERAVRTLNGRPYIVFTVPRDYMRQGNAVVAVRDEEGTVMWSWHIWITDALSADAVPTTNHNGRTYWIMPQDLGFCYGESVGWTSKERVVYLRLTQKRHVADGIELASPKEQTITIWQNAGSGTTELCDNAPFYQWGRKDPFAPGAGKAVYQSMDGEKTFYTEFPNWQYRSPSSHLNYMTVNLDYDTDAIPAISAAIQNPMTLYRNINRYNGSPYYVNLWSADCSAAEAYAPEAVSRPTVSKTVYDPCPVGYCVPPIGAFNGFVTSNANAYKTGSEALSLARGLEHADSRSNGINGYNTSSSYTWRFYGDGSSEAAFCCLGVRDLASNLNSLGWGTIQNFRQYDMTNALICRWYAGWMANGKSAPNPAFMRITRNTGSNNPYAYRRTVEIVACSQYGISAYPVRPVKEQH